MLSTFKMVATVFWDNYGVIPYDCIPQRETINAETYYENLKKTTAHNSNSQHRPLSNGVVLLHDDILEDTRESFLLGSNGKF